MDRWLGSPAPTLLSPLSLRKKEGNLVRGYPSILQWLLCLSCALCFLNTIHAERTVREKAGLYFTTKKSEAHMTSMARRKSNTIKAALQMAVQWDLCSFLLIKKESRLTSAINTMSLWETKNTHITVFSQLPTSLTTILQRDTAHYLDSVSRRYPRLTKAIYVLPCDICNVFEVTEGLKVKGSIAVSCALMLKIPCGKCIGRQKWRLFFHTFFHVRNEWLSWNIPHMQAT